MVSQTRVVLNREALAAIDLGLAQGLESLAMEVLRIVEPPDRTPFGEGLVDQGGWITYVDGKRVGGDPRVTRKPKGFRVRGKGVAVAVGFGFPARFQELGTANQPARPFLTPAVMRVVGDETLVVNALKSALDAALAGKRRRLTRRAAR